MDESIEELKRELFEIGQQLGRRGHIAPSVPGVTTGEAHVLLTLEKMRAMGEDARSGMLARHAHTTPSALSQTLKTLEAKGLIDRQRAGGDSRGVTVILTDAGIQTTTRAWAAHRALIDEMLAYLGEDDLRELVRIMRRIAAFQESRAASRRPDADAPLRAPGAAPIPHPIPDQRNGGTPCAS